MQRNAVLGGGETIAHLGHCFPDVQKYGKSRERKSSRPALRPPLLCLLTKVVALQCRFDAM